MIKLINQVDITYLYTISTAQKGIRRLVQKNNINYIVNFAAEEPCR